MTPTTRFPGVSAEVAEGLARAEAEGRIISDTAVAVPAGASGVVFRPGAPLQLTPAELAGEIKAANYASRVIEHGRRDRRRPPEPAPELSASASLSVVVRGHRLKSEANAGGQLWAKIKRKSRAWEATILGLDRVKDGQFPLPCSVHMVRLGKGRLDNHDNLPMAFKVVVDCVAEWLGVDDSDARVTWSYDQAPSWFDGFSIRFEERTA